MPYSSQAVTSDGTLETVDVTFSFIDRSEIHVYFDSIEQTSGWAWVGTEKRIEFTPAVPDGVVVLIRRITDLSKLRHEYSAGAAFRADTLDESLEQVLHIAQEATEAQLGGDFFADIDMHSNSVVNLQYPETDPTAAVSLKQYQEDALGAHSAKTIAENAAGNAMASATNALNSRNQAQGFATNASDSASAASGSATTAGIAKTQAESARDAAVTARDKAQDWAESPTAVETGQYSAKYWADDAAASAVLAGDNARLGIGTVTTGAAGSTADASITGSVGAQSLNLTIPRGDKGDTGDPAAPSVVPVSAQSLLTADLDTIITPGFYRQVSDGDATTGRHYPITTAGSLVVYSTAASSVVQEYTGYNAAVTPAGGKFYRSYTAGTWSAWVKLMRGDVDVLAITNGGTGATTMSAARTNLGLGTASTATVVTGTSDSTTGRLISVGWGGLGASASNTVSINNLEISGSGRRITGDFSSGGPSDYSARVAFQTSTPNSTTAVGVCPSGSGTQAGFSVWPTSTMANTHFGEITASATVVSVASRAVGSGTVRDLELNAGNNSKWILRNNGHMFGSANGAATWPLNANQKGVLLAGSGDSPSGFATRAGSQSTISVGSYTQSGNSSALLYFFNTEPSTPSFVGSIDHNGTSTSYNTSSDYRLKEALTPMAPALPKLRTIPLWDYTWKVSGMQGCGVMAHELQAVIPEAVSGTKDDVDDTGGIRPQGVDYSKVVPYLIKAVQEQQEQIEVLTNRITLLESSTMRF